MKHYLEDELYSYLDGEVDEQSRLEIEAHLKDCTTCAKVIGDWQPLQSILSSSAKVEHSERFTANVMAKIQPKAERQEIANWKELLLSWLSPAVQLTATILLLLFGQFGTTTYSNSDYLFATLDSNSGEQLLIIDPYNTDSLSTLLEEI
jgi:anti-sigma factor RsiW